MRAARRIPLPAAALALVLATLASGCGNDGADRGYVVPETLCGVTVAPELLEPLLPPGEEITVSTHTPAGSITACEVSVDGKEAFSVRREWWEEGWSARRFAESQAYVDPEKESGGGGLVWSGRGAVAAVECRDPDFAGQALFVVAKMEADGRSDAPAVRGFTEAYGEAYAGSDACSGP
ncbi:hypothetical protein [Streptomyces sp. JJ36]|uniref:hypothetical protein n=1 Tax=Streptomyces sp. JJ36 TaxID=2736645 RepID=UPI001F1B1DBF|nr:hypothetical protein [Streptomyces sp. JJ36]MCF6526266.1 hypothetical protein [Streptomyces sp. JJ36]